MKGLELLKSVLPEGTIQDIFTIEELGEALTHYAAMLVSPFFFTLVFCPVSIVIAIIVGLLVKIVPPFKKPGMLLNRLGGALVGVLCGFLVTLILLMPIVGTIDLVASLDSLQSADSETAEADEIADLLHSAAEDKSVDLLLKVGCGPVYNYFSSTKFEGERVYLRDEISAVLHIVENIDAFKGELSTYGDKEIAALREIVANLETSPLMENTVAGIFSTAAQKWIAGETFIGIAKPSAGEMLDPVIDTMLTVISTSDKDTIGPDLETMTEVFAILIENGMFEHGDDVEAMLSHLSSSDVISSLITTINANERMAPLADEVVDLSIRALASTIGIPENDQARYDLLMQNVADIVSSSYGMDDAERAEHIEADLSAAFEHYGVEVEGEAIENISVSIVNDLGDDPDLTANDVQEFFAVYAIASGESAKAGDNRYDLLTNDKSAPTVTVNEDGSISINGKRLENYTADSYRSSGAYSMGSVGADFGKAATLYSAETMESTLITMDDICSSLGKYSDCENIAEEAEKIGNIISTALETFSDIDFETATPEELMPKMGEMLDLMNSSDVFGQELTSNMLTAILQSDLVADSLGISTGECTKFANKINEMVEGGHFDYTHATEIISDTLGVIDSTGNGEKTKEEKREDSQKLINSITKESAEMLGTMVNPSMIENYGVPESNSEAVSSAVTSLLNNMASYESGEDTASSEKEADAVSTLLDLAMTGSQSEGALFNGDEGEGTLNTTADEFIDLVVTSEVVSTTVDELIYQNGYNDNPLGISDLGDQDKESITGAIEDYYASNGGGEDLARQLEAIAALLNVDVELER